MKTAKLIVVKICFNLISLTSVTKTFKTILNDQSRTN